jgi:hypothetical protein
VATESPANGVSTTLSAGITNSATSCSLTSATGFTNAQYHCLISDGTNNEIVTATALSGTTLTITRASETWNGSATAYAFSSGAKITIVATVQSVQNLINQATIISSVTVSGTPAAGNVLTATSSTAADWAAPAAASLSYVESYISSDVPSSGSNTNVTSVSLTAGTWLIEGTFSALNSASASQISLFIGPTSASETAAYAMAAGSASASQYVSLSARKVVVLGSTTTVYLISSSINSYTVKANTSGLGAVESGITAVRIA